MIKLLKILTLLLATSIGAHAGTCTSISRTNNSSNTVLTSAKYNADLNTVYGATNNLDAGCLTDGTLEASALNTADFAVPLRAIKAGCQVTRSDSSTLSVERCLLAVNGEFVSTTTAVTVTWGCTGCAAEANSTRYYLYARDGSSGSTLNLLISTTAPNGDGYDGSNNRILGSFYNDPSGNIIDYVSTAEVTGIPSVTNSRGYQSPVTIEGCKVNNPAGTASIDTTSTLCQDWVSSVTSTAAGRVDISFKSTIFRGVNPVCACVREDDIIGGTGSYNCTVNTATDTVRVYTTDLDKNNVNANFSIICIGIRP